MAETTQQKLDSVQATIQAIEAGGQDVHYNGRRVTMANIKELYARETYLERKLDREGRGGLRVRRGTPT